MREQFAYITVIICLINVRGVLEFLGKQDSTTFIIALDGTLTSILHALLWFNRKKAGDKFALCVLLLCLLNNVQRVVSSFLQLRFAETDDIHKTIILKRNLEFLKQKAIYTAMFSLPCMSYLGMMLAGFTTSMLVLSYGFVSLSE